MPIAHRLFAVFFLPALALVSAVTVAQDFRPLSDRAMRIWDTQHGLPHNSINHITQDSQGYLWIATWQGPVRFNGRTFEVFDDETQLPDPGALFIGENPYTNTIVATGARGGVSYFKSALAGGQWQAQPRVFDRVDFALFATNECTWYATVTTGVVRDCDGKRTQFTTKEGLPSDSILSLAKDSTGRIWAATDRGPAYFQPKTATFTTVAGLPSGYNFGIVSDQNTKDLWLSIDESIYRLNVANLNYERWPVTYPSTVTELYQAPNGVIWVGTHEHGLTQLDDQSAVMTTVANGLPNNHILSIFVDRENTLWVGTHRGLTQFREAPFHSHRKEDGLGYDYVRALMQRDDGSILVGGLGGIKQIANETILPFPTSSKVAKESILTFAQSSDGLLYIGTFTNGLYVLRNGEQIAHYNETNGFPGNDIRSVLLADDGYLYAATSRGVLRAKRRRNGELETPDYFGVAEGLPDEIIYAIHQSPTGDIWIGSMRGLSVLKDQAIQRINLSAITNAEFMFGFHESGQHLYVASDRGLILYNKQTEQWQVFDDDNGLPFVKFFDVTRDLNGNVWLATGRGLYVIAANDFERAVFDDNPATPLPYSFYESFHGLASAQINTGGPPMLVDRDGHLWFATSQGVGHYLPANLAALNGQPPDPVIEAVEADGSKITPGTYLDAQTGRIEFNFAGLGFHHPESIRYRVQLAGYDDSWVTPNDNQLSVAYTELPPGAYIFQVQTAYPNGQWSDAATFTFHKLPTLWQRPTTWLVSALLLLITVVAVVRLRSYQLKRSKERLQDLVREQTKSLEQLAHQDSLTLLANRRAFDLFLREKVARTAGHQLGLILLDLDYFKDINDRYLHTTGDKVLKRVAQIITTTARESDMVARWGGEEFAILLTNTDRQQLNAVCERMRNALETADLHDLVSDLSVTGSFGAALHEPNETAASLLRRADKALYQAKSNGRNRTELAPARD
ncbi:ligand-binding sensor domain-containing diguanylate cyclase [Pseudidiomarina homiensis]|uniref:ligand-binding sensor domain-containing diguanylate cyclase n=1 Tax=Pseudidiomarina homiensis TaxID=364198 RepID=UPI00215A8278|nr:ligand-binding sensor domain-containing diguanylate cyclase [Pseudidiomarina homiensis]